MEIKVEIYEKHNVRPFSPTPQSSRIYKLSVLDQLASTFYLPIVLFYAAPGFGTHRHDYDELKESLSRMLSVLHPFAGRLKEDGLTIECNDEGVDFVQANVTNYDLADFLRLPKLHLLRKLLPCDPYPMAFDPAQPILAVQANRFRCGGTAVAICVWHALIDGAGLVGFLQTWTEIINRREGTTSSSGGSLLVDATPIFSPINFQISKFVSEAADRRKRNRGKYTAKRFVILKQEIERMRDEYKQPDHRHPSRVEALSAFIWAAVIRATLQSNQSLKTHVLTNVVNLRKRMNPPFPPTCLGNINQFSVARWEADGGVVTAHSLMERVREAIEKVTDDYVRKMHVNGGYIKKIFAQKNQVENVNDHQILSISSWCNFPFHEVDFRWGKPIWVSPSLNLENLVVLLDTANGNIEVWIGLLQEVMCNLDKDKEFLAHVFCSQILSE